VKRYAGKAKQVKDTKGKIAKSRKTATPTAAPKRVRGDGIKRLAKASARALRDNGDGITKKLLGKALRGDVSCARLLIALAEKKTPPDPAKMKMPEGFESASDMLRRLAAEPEWVDPLNDPDNPPPAPQVETYLTNTAP
jgi:hypothetical protein